MKKIYGFLFLLCALSVEIQAAIPKLKEFLFGPDLIIDRTNLDYALQDYRALKLNVVADVVTNTATDAMTIEHFKIIKRAQMF